MWTNKYIGIPFKAKGRDASGVDCWGLVRLVYANEYGIQLPSFEQEYIIEDTKRIAELIAQYREGWTPVSNPEPGDIVLFRILGQPTHVGIMINKVEFLHSRRGYDVAIGSLTSTRWAGRALGFYKYSTQTEAALHQLPPALKTSVIPWAITEPTTLDRAVTKLLELQPADKDTLVVLVNNTAIPQEYWTKVTLENNDIVAYRTVPGNDARSILTLAAIIVISIYVPQIAYNMSLPGATATSVVTATGSSAMVYSAPGWVAAASIAATASINAIFPVRPPAGPTDPGSTEAQLMVEGGGNRATPYTGIPVVLGKIRLTPPLAGQNFITYPGDRRTDLTTAVAWGFAPLQLTNFKIGEANITDYVISKQATVTGLNSPTYSQDVAEFDQIYGRDVNQANWQATELTCDGNPEGIQGPLLGYDEDGNAIYGAPLAPTPGIYLNPPASSDTANQVEVAFHMPEGMRKIAVRGAGAGNSFNASVQIQTQIKFGTNPNTPWSDWETFTISGAKKDAFTIVKKYEIPAGQPEQIIQIQARRLTGDNTEDNPDWRYQHKVLLLNVTYTSSRNPIVNPPGCVIARSAYVIQANDQLSGQLEGINAIAQSVCKPVINPTTGAQIVTSNPAALFLHVLTHPANPQRILLTELNERIDMAQLEHWYNYCDTTQSITYENSDSSGGLISKNFKYEYNGVIADQRSVLEVLRDICAAGRASPTLIDGKWTVTIDEPKTAITQHFSPQNSWGFEAVRTIPKEPDGLKVTFYNEEQNYQQAETIVYNSGKNYSNSTLFETIDLPGVTNIGAVIDHAKWHFAQAKLRRELYSINCDIEYLSCNRGDRVKVTHDVPAWGSGSARVAAKYGNAENNSMVIKTTEYLAIDATKTYNLRVRGKTGISTVFPVLSSIPFTGFTRTGNTITIQLSTSVVPVIPFESTDTISIECSSFPLINITNQKVTVNRTNNTISYTIAVATGSIGLNVASGNVKLTGEYEYLAIGDSQGTSTPATTPSGTGNTNIIDIGDLFLFGEVNKESQDLLVLSIEPQDNKTAKLTLVDYGVTDTYNIFTQYRNLSENVVFNTNITLPPKKAINVFTSYIVPQITNIYSDTPAVETLSPGTFRYNIRVSYATITKQIPVNTKYVECQYYLSTTGNPEQNIKSVYSEYMSNTITIPDVMVGQQYYIRLRYVTADGVVGPWPVPSVPSTNAQGWTLHKVDGFKKNLETVTAISVTRVGRFFRILINSAKPDNFKEFKIKVYKNNGSSVQDFWSVVDAVNIRTYTTSTNSIDVNILDFQTPRLSEAGTQYRIACRPVDIAGTESQSASALTSITLTTINP